MREDPFASLGVERRGGVRIARRLASEMVRVVAENVGDGVYQLCRRREDARVEVIRKDVALAFHEPIQRLRQPDAKALHPPGKRRAGVGFDDQMDVVALHAELDDAQPEPAERIGEASLD